MTYNNKKIPESTISRLFVYLRELTGLSKVNIRTISSAELGERTNLSDAQVRKDLGYFGQFGVSGSGYDVAELKKALEKILGKDKVWDVVLVGAGRLGSALLTYSGFKQHGLNIVAAFDTDERKVDRKIEGVPVKPLDKIADSIKDRKVLIGVIAVPAKAAQEVADIMVGAGIKCMLNFAPASINVPDSVKLKNVDLSRELETLSFFLVNKNNGAKK